MQLYLVRHGDNVVKLSHKTNGHIDGYIDAGLSDIGREQVATLADGLPHLVESIDRLYTSTLARAQETAAVIGQAYGRQPQGDVRLHELGCNRGDGLPWSDDDLPGGFNVSKAVDPFAPVSPATGQESWHDFRRRVGNFVEELVTEQRHQNVMVVCHGGVINAVVDHIFNLGPWRRCDVLPPKASITHIEYVGAPDRETWLLYYLGRTVWTQPQKS